MGALFPKSTKWRQPKGPSTDECLNDVINTYNGILFTLKNKGNPTNTESLHWMP